MSEAPLIAIVDDDELARDGMRELVESPFIRVKNWRASKIKGDMKRRKPIVIPGDGDPCPRCGVPMQIREPDGIGDRQRRQPFFYTRWFCCMNKQCKTTLVMPERYKVANSVLWASTSDA